MPHADDSGVRPERAGKPFAGRTSLTPLLCLLVMAPGSFCGETTTGNGGGDTRGKTLSRDVYLAPARKNGKDIIWPRPEIAPPDTVVWAPEKPEPADASGFDASAPEVVDANTLKGMTAEDFEKRYSRLDKYAASENESTQTDEGKSPPAPDLTENGEKPRRRLFRFGRKDAPVSEIGEAGTDAAASVASGKEKTVKSRWPKRAEPDAPAPQTLVAEKEEAKAVPPPVPEPRHATRPAPPPSREEVEDYRLRLEDRLLERYNNLPEHAGKVAKVSVVLSRPMDISLDGSLIRAEFDQLVYDPWGKRIPALEKEYYVVTFGSGGTQQVRSDPSIRVGLDMEKTYSERAPLAADPFRNAPESEAFRPTPKVKMPDWWRPDFPESE